MKDKKYKKVEKISINSSGMVDYVTALYEDRIVIYQGKYVLYEINRGTDSGISGASFLDGILVFTKAGEDNFFVMRVYDQKTKVYQAGSECKQIKLLKCVKGKKSAGFLMEIYQDDKKSVEVYTISEDKLHKEYVLPYTNVIDIGQVEEENIIVEVCDEQEERHDKNNEVYCKNYTAIAKIYTKQNNEIKIDTLGITTEENNGQFKAYEDSNGGLHFPLLNFFNSFSKYLGLTSEANMIIYYNENLNCLILSSVHNSAIEYLIQLPEKYTKVDEIMFFFNEQSKILTVCDWKGLRITRFMVKSNLKDLHNLNKIYSYNQSQRIRCDKRFTSLEKSFYKALFGTTLEEIANIEINNRESDRWKEREGNSFLFMAQ